MKPAVLSSEPLPDQGPWPTEDPFLFCVAHRDQYPQGNAKFGPKMGVSGRTIGSDFSNRNGWNMYHGQEVPGFPRHPHRGFETVTVVKKGMIDHADSLGATARYGDGDVQWLTAGDGIEHSEMFPLLSGGQNNPIDFFQIWLNLPARSKRVQPYFSMFWADKIPQKHVKDEHGHLTHIEVVSGRFFGLIAPTPPPNSWAHDPQNSVGILRIEMESDATWRLPATVAGLNRSLYVANGSVSALDTTVSKTRLILRSESDLLLRAGADGASLLLLEGRPIDEPVFKHGPFVMNSRAEIVEAFSDYRRGTFGQWSFSTSEPVHGGERARFARHADGRVEKPS